MQLKEQRKVRVLELCWSEERTWSDIKERLRIPEASLFRILSELVEHGYLEKREDGKYYITEKGREFLLKNLLITISDREKSAKEFKDMIMRLENILQEEEAAACLVAELEKDLKKSLGKRPAIKKLLELLGIKKYNLTEILAYLLASSIDIKFSRNAEIDRDKVIEQVFDVVCATLGGNKARLELVPKFYILIGFDIDRGYDSLIKYIREQKEKASNEDEKAKMDALEVIFLTEKDYYKRRLLELLAEIGEEIMST